MELILLGTLPLEEAKSLQRTLHGRGVEAQLDHNQKTCTRGCAVTVEVLVPRESIAEVQEVLRTQYEKLTAGLDVDWQRVSAVFDPSKEEATCPACGTQFSTGLGQCPDCGLCF